MKPTITGKAATAAQFVVWWGANSLYAIDAQKLLRHFDNPLLVIDLVVFQVAVGLLISLLIHSLWRKDDNLKSKTSLLKDTKSFSPIALVIGILHASATVLTNFSYLVIGSSSTLVWKLTEPFSAVVLKRIVLQESTTFTSMIGVFFVVAGVSTYSLKDWNVLSFSPIILSNVLFPSRNILVKLDQKRGKPDQEIPTEQRYFRLLFSSMPFCILALVMRLVFEAPIVESFPYLLKNAILFNAYQFSSIALLEKLDALTHSLANTMKRFIGILLSALIHGEQVGTRHVVGLTLAAIGFPLYAQGGKLHSLRNFRRSVFVVVVFAAMMMVFVDTPSMIVTDDAFTERFGWKVDSLERNGSTAKRAHPEGVVAHSSKDEVSEMDLYQRPMIRVNVTSESEKQTAYMMKRIGRVGCRLN